MSSTASETTITRTLTSLCSCPAPFGECAACSILVSMSSGNAIRVARIVQDQQWAGLQIAEEIAHPDAADADQDENIGPINFQRPLPERRFHDPEYIQNANEDHPYGERA